MERLKKQKISMEGSGNSVIGNKTVFAVSVYRKMEVLSSTEEAQMSLN